MIHLLAHYEGFMKKLQNDFPGSEPITGLMLIYMKHIVHVVEVRYIISTLIILAAHFLDFHKYIPAVFEKYKLFNVISFEITYNLVIMPLKFYFIPQNLIFLHRRLQILFSN